MNTANLGRDPFSWLSSRAEMQHHLSYEIYEPINHGVSEAFQLWLSSDSVGDADELV